MFGWRRREKAPSNPAVGPIEELLTAASARHPAGARQGRTLHLIWICACMAEDDSPDWRIWSTESGVDWRRQPGWSPERRAVAAEMEAEGHTDPAQVLAWLRGEASDPWGEVGDGWGDPEVWIELQRRITSC